MKAARGKSSLNSSAGQAIAAAILLAAMPAHAQQSGAITDYRLPDPNRTPAPRVQGPVDPDNPFGTPTPTPQPERTPAITPTPAPPPRITIPAPQQTPSRQEQPTEQRATRTPAATTNRAVTQDSPAPSPSPNPAPAPSSSAGDGLVAPPPTVKPAPAPNIATKPITPETPDDWLIPGLLGLAVLGGGAIWFLRRRRPAQDTAIELVPAVSLPDSAIPPLPEKQPEPHAAALATIPAHAETSLAVEPFHLATVFSATAVRLSLVYATVQYQLEVANAGAFDLPPLQVRGDLISAHNSLRTQDQLAPPPEQLDIKHTLPALAPGETQILKGEVRVPLHETRPLEKGTARFLVPLVRFCVLAPGGEGIRRVFTVGPHDPGSGAIASVRLDAGPRNLRELGSREIEGARGFALDQAVVHS